MPHSGNNHYCVIDTAALFYVISFLSGTTVLIPSMFRKVGVARFTSSLDSLMTSTKFSIMLSFIPQRYVQCICVVFRFATDHHCVVSHEAAIIILHLITHHRPFHSTPQSDLHLFFKMSICICCNVSPNTVSTSDYSDDVSSWPWFTTQPGSSSVWCSTAAPTIGPS